MCKKIPIQKLHTWRERFLKDRKKTKLTSVDTSTTMPKTNTEINARPRIGTLVPSMVD